MSTAQATEKNSRSKDKESSILLRTLIAFKNGNFAVRMPVDRTAMAGKIADALNDVIELNQRMASELDRISQSVGKAGKIAQRASLGSARGSWGECIESVNSLIGDLVQQFHRGRARHWSRGQRRSFSDYVAGS
jgi:hypothetical protein